MRINVLIADGRKLVREGVCLLLERHDDIYVVGEAADVASAAKLVRALPVHVVVLNLAQPALGGLQSVRTLLRAAGKPKVQVVVLTLSPDGQSVRDLLEAGAGGCLTKDSAGAELVEAIRAAKRGKPYLSPSLVELLVTGYARPADRPPAEQPLAPKERVVLQRIAAGETTKEIASALSVSTKTVETHRRRLMLKLNRHSVAELTKYALLQGMATLETPI